MPPRRLWLARAFLHSNLQKVATRPPVTAHRKLIGSPLTPTTFCCNPIQPKGCYYFGVVDCWNKYIPRERVNRVTGASAGSLSAAYYLMGLPLGQCVRQVIAMMEDIRKRPFGVFDRSNQIVDVLPRELDKTFPEDAHKRVNGRLYVCMTRLRDFKCIVVNEFESKKDLIDVSLSA